MHKLTRFILALALSLLAWSLGWTQVSYTHSYLAGVGNPGGLNVETDFDQTGWSVLQTGGLLSNSWSSSLAIPFSFEYFGQNVTQLKASANGLITFDVTTAILPGDNETLPAPSLPTNTIACWWDAFSTSPPTGTNDQIQYKVFGTAPNRQLWVRWYSFEWGGTSFVYVATVLEESSNKIYLVDQYGSLTSSWITSTVGLQRNLAWHVMAAGDSEALSGAGSTPSDNSYFEFTPFVIPPQDLRPVSITAPAEAQCGMGLEPVTVTFVNQGQLPASGITAQFRVDGAPAISPESIPGTLAAGDSVTYTFSQLANLSGVGTHEVKVWSNATGDSNTSNDSLTIYPEHILQVSSLPYREEFENGAAGWVAGGANNSWELGIPANTRIQGASSGLNAWITGRTVPHNSFEQSWVVSPCFDLTNAVNDTWVGLHVWWECEAGWDGATLQSSTDGGLTWSLVGDLNSPDWFNYPSIGSQPGGEVQGWSGMFQTNNGSNGYRWVTHKLSSDLIGQNGVRFRIAFGAGGAQNADGFAFDDFTIGTPPTVDLGTDGYRCEGFTLYGNIGGGTDFEWSTGDSSPTLTLINATGAPVIDSMITVRVYNALGLSRRDTLVYSMNLPITATLAGVDSARCAGEASGALQLSISGGLAPYSFTWDQGISGQNPDNLTAGTYTGLLRDANGCPMDLPEVSIPEPLPLTVASTVADVSCFGDSNGSISLAATGGNGQYSAHWDTGDSALAISGLVAGSYAYNLLDHKGCELPGTALVHQPDSLMITDLIGQDANCVDSEDGRISLAPTGGTAPYTYEWSYGATSDTATGLAPGTYSVQVQDSMGCMVGSDSITLTYTDTLPTADFGFNIVGGMVQFRDSSLGGQSFTWDFGNGDNSSQRNPNYFYPENGSYTVQLIVSNACGSDTITQFLTLETVSIQRLNTLDMKVAPNPGTGAFTLLVGSEDLGAGHITLLSLNGQRLKQIALGRMAAGTRIPLTFPDEAPEGLYLIQIHTKAGDQLFKVSIQR